MKNRTEYTLWAIPTGNTYTLLKRMADIISAKYHTMEIEPHVTVQGSIFGDEDDILRKTALLASSLHPYHLQLTRIGYIDDFFRALFYRVRESVGVKEANRKAREIFGIKDGPYMPHLSIMYGDIPLEEKKKIVAEIPRNLNVKFYVDAIHLYAIEWEGDSWKNVRKVREFALG